MKKEGAENSKESTKGNNSAYCSLFSSLSKVNRFPDFEATDSETRWWWGLEMRTSLFPSYWDIPGECVGYVTRTTTCPAFVSVPGSSASTHSTTRCSWLGALLKEVTPKPGFPVEPTVTSHIKILWNLGKDIYPNADNSILSNPPQKKPCILYYFNDIFIRNIFYWSMTCIQKIINEGS